jgi:hypothetical protein
VIYGEYEVTGRRQYRGHDTGTRFEAKHDVAKERAIARGNIRLLRLITPAAPRNGTLPDGWPPPSNVPPQPHPEAPEGASLVTEGG